MQPASRHTPAAPRQQAPLAELAILPVRSGQGQPVTRLPVTFEVLKSLGAAGALRQLAADDLRDDPAPAPSVRERVVAKLGLAAQSAPSRLALTLTAVRKVLVGEFHQHGLGDALLKLNHHHLADGYSKEFINWVMDGKTTQPSAEFANDAIMMTARILAANEETARLTAEVAHTKTEPLSGRALYTCAYGMLNQALDTVLPGPDDDGNVPDISRYTIRIGTVPELIPALRRGLIADFYAGLDTKLGGHEDSRGGEMTFKQLDALVQAFSTGVTAEIRAGTLPVPGVGAAGSDVKSAGASR